MATLSDLTEILSAVTGIPEATVFAYGRFARESGRISQTGRGLGAASMTFEDAANLLIAVCGVAVTREAEKAIEIFRPARGTISYRGPPKEAPFRNWADQFGLPEILPPSEIDMPFGKLLELLIEMAGNGSLENLLRQIPSGGPNSEYWSQIDSEDQAVRQKALEKGYFNLKPPEEIEIGIDVSMDLSFVRSHARVEIRFLHLWGDDEQGLEQYVGFRFSASVARRAARGLLRGARDMQLTATVSENTLIALGRTVLNEPVPAHLLSESKVRRRLARMEGNT